MIFYSIYIFFLLKFNSKTSLLSPPMKGKLTIKVPLEHQASNVINFKLKYTVVSMTLAHTHNSSRNISIIFTYFFNIQ